MRREEVKTLPLETIKAAFAKEPFAWHVESVNLTDGRVRWWACLWGDMPDGDVETFEYEADTEDEAVRNVALQAIEGRL